MEHETASNVIVMDITFWTATLIFAISYIVIMSEKVHKTVVAMAAAGLMLLLRIISQHEAFHIGEMNALSLLYAFAVAR